MYEPGKPVPFITSSNKLRPSFILTTPEPLKDEVALLQGPERLMTGWWDGNDIIRDYFIARSQQGRWLWIFVTKTNSGFSMVSLARFKPCLMLNSLPNQLFFSYRASC